MASVYINHSARGWVWTYKSDHGVDKQHDGATSSAVLAFHRLLPSYSETPLHDIPSVAARLGLRRVLLKDESQRFGLPSFKILGASWAVYRAVAARVGHSVVADGDSSSSSTLSLESLAAKARDQHIGLVACTEGNWGRAVAYMARCLGVPARIFVPEFMPRATRDIIAAEGAEVVVVPGDYDEGVAAARRFAEMDKGGALLVMDIAWEGYEEIPQWVVEGYTTMLTEADDQHTALEPGVSGPERKSDITHVIVPVGCGSIAQAVTQHFKSATRRSSLGSAVVVAVEPTTAACLRASLEAGAATTVVTGNSIMAGLNCGTLSSAAWPILRAGVDASVIASDWQAHEAVRVVEAMGISAGPCGAVTLAALERACRESRRELGLDETAVVLLCCTEGPREYEIPVQDNA